ncbi:mitochondrial ribosomal protein S29 isoform X2 [Lycorma delicatula]|uniref:mitochondrial ribosomal protein S29 isoform X2 n=1 Tax=Lycorma delicatula TaxID=130591 RepID=UPI003F51A2D8
MSMRIANVYFHQKAISRLMSTEAVVSYKRPVALRTAADPLSQGEHDVGHFYTIPKDVCENFFALGGFPNNYRKSIKTFGEASLMVRDHTVEFLNYLKKANYNHPVIRYVIYGKPGCGKSMTLSHVLHYAYLSNFIVLHVPWVWNWYRRNLTEVVPSDTKEGLYNLPVEAATWLKYFQKQNAHILSSPDLRLSKEYVWSQREISPADAPLQELITHGIGRIRYACDVIDVLVNELKLLSSQGRCKVLIAIDGFNQFFLQFSNIKNAEKRIVLPDQVTLAQTFLSAVRADWLLLAQSEPTGVPGGCTQPLLSTTI